MERRGDACYPEIKGTQKRRDHGKEEMMRVSRQLQKIILQSSVCGESRESAVCVGVQEWHESFSEVP